MCIVYRHDMVSHKSKYSFFNSIQINPVTEPSPAMWLPNDTHNGGKLTITKQTPKQNHDGLNE